MANPRRIPGKGGLKPRDPDRRVLYVEDYLTGDAIRPASRLFQPRDAEAQAGVPIPQVGPGTLVDRLTKVASWPMYLNDQLGDCFWAGEAHASTSQRVYAGYPEVHFANAAITKGYESAGYVPGDPSTDNGTDPAQGLKYLHDVGWMDQTGVKHQLAGYAFFRDVANFRLQAEVLAATGSLGIGFTCTQEYEDAFSEGIPCQVVPGDQPVGGHWITRQARLTGVTGILDDITWGGAQRMTLAYHRAQVIEVAMKVSQDYVTASGTTIQGLRLGDLLEDMSQVE